MIQRLREAGLLWPMLAALPAIAILVSLGSWQLNRKAWKEELLATISERMVKPPADLTSDDVTGERKPPGVYTPVRVRGRLLHEHERYFFSDGPQGSGYHVFTPLELAPHRIVWINRGYVPRRLQDPATRQTGQVTDLIEVTGLVRKQGERNLFTPENDVARNIWFWRDIDGLTGSAFPAGAVIAAPFVIDAARTPEQGGGWPQGGTTIVKFPNRHLEYALTWYGLATTLVGVLVAYAWTKLRRRAVSQASNGPS